MVHKGWVAALAMGIAAAGSAAAGGITGAGATFPFPVYAVWAHAYQAASGESVNYQSIGSTGGLRIRERMLTFGATDIPQGRGDLGKWQLTQFPTLVGGVVPVVNLSGIAPGRLVLSGPVLADIFLGKIAMWNDPAIRRLNPGLKLPAQAIAPVHRSDGSGTTYIFSSYLARANAAWRKDAGVGPALGWPVGIGAKGNEGVTHIVMRTAGAVGYVEYAYAKQNKLSYARLIGGGGQPVAPSVETFRRAMVGVDWAVARGQGFQVDLLNRPGAWPITAPTYILVPLKPWRPGESAKALRFFAWAFAHGREKALALGYVPLPDEAVRAVTASWAAVADK